MEHKWVDRESWHSGNSHTAHDGDWLPAEEWLKHFVNRVKSSPISPNETHKKWPRTTIIMTVNWFLIRNRVFCLVVENRVILVVHRHKYKYTVGRERNDSWALEIDECLGFHVRNFPPIVLFSKYQYLIWRLRFELIFEATTPMLSSSRWITDSYQWTLSMNGLLI